MLTFQLYKLCYDQNESYRLQLQCRLPDLRLQNRHYAYIYPLHLFDHSAEINIEYII